MRELRNVVALGVLMILPACTVSAAVVQTTLYVSPAGSGSACTSSLPCSLSGAQSKVRALLGPNMSGDIVVNLLGGTYDRHVNAPLALTASDSGRNGFYVIWQAAPNAVPILSGAVSGLTWTNSVRANIKRAFVGTGLASRSLWVNSARAQRARGQVGSPTVNPTGWSVSDTGINTAATDLRYLTHWNEIEVVGFRYWRHFRCPVSSIFVSDGHNIIAMQQPCWGNSFDGVKMIDGTDGCQRIGNQGYGFSLVSWLENVDEFLDEAGEFYFDRAAGYLYYRPHVNTPNRAPDNLSTALFATSERLLDLNGAHHLKFKGIRFANTTWMQPSSGSGYVEVQTGFHTVGGTGIPCEDSTKHVEIPPGMVAVHGGHDLVFERNVFTRSGSSGLSFDAVSVNNQVIGNVFKDTAGAGLHIGDSFPGTAGFVVNNNYILDASRIYYSVSAMTIGHVKDTIVKHNEVNGSSYSGISFGWGFGADCPVDGTSTQCQSNNSLDNNLVQNVMKSPTYDGGGIYSNQHSPFSFISKNYIRDVGYAGQPQTWALYMDSGVSGQNLQNNLIELNGDLTPAQWINVKWGGNAVVNNYTYQAAGFICQSTSSPSCECLQGATGCVPTGGNVTSNNLVWSPSNPGLPAWATALQAQGCVDDSCAGIQQAYQSVKSIVP